MVGVGGWWQDKSGAFETFRGIEVSLLTSAATEIRADGLDGAGTVVGNFYHGSGGTSKAGLEIRVFRVIRG